MCVCLFPTRLTNNALSLICPRSRLCLWSPFSRSPPLSSPQSGRGTPRASQYWRPRRVAFFSQNYEPLFYLGRPDRTRRSSGASFRSGRRSSRVNTVGRPGVVAVEAYRRRCVYVPLPPRVFYLPSRRNHTTICTIAAICHSLPGTCSTTLGRDGPGTLSYFPLDPTQR
ncbi:hypothetical protein BV25DRAFT_1117496 [Artomyces pyxidatus]|uniref:Uncharacterized protein n=1 Tax=Artomyces pyxidatus TaxID=48021 RepID=A0ACB8ST77_9AGAM|nr:hypothetical protein BV25DRAFT_1117496 [Artomyces pyxidatus]